MKLPPIFSILVALACCTPVVKSQGCEMTIEVFESAEDCGSNPTVAGTGTIYADGECRRVETSASGLVYDMLPGIYRAECNDKGEITFLDSGCYSNTCSSPSGEDVCDGDNTLPSYIYARVGSAFVTSPSASGRTCWEASYINSNQFEFFVYFAIYGECNAQCASGPAPATDPPIREPVLPPTNPPIAPTVPPVSPTEPPVEPTDAPTKSPIDAPVPQPTDAPTKSPIDALVPQPTDAPISEPTPTAPVPTPAPVVTPTAKPPTPPPAPDSGMVTSSTKARLRFFPHSDLLPVNRLEGTWVDVTEQYIKQNAESGGFVIDKLEVLSPQQALAQNRRFNRQLQDQALVISFTLESTHENTTNAERIFQNAFASASGKRQYLASLTNELPELDDVEFVTILDDDDNNNGGGGETVSASKNSSTGIIAGVVIAVVVVAAGIAGFLVWRRKKGKPGTATATSRSSKKQSPKQELTASSSDPAHIMPQQTEIVVNAALCDDISTLEGGTVFENMTLGRQGRVHDDPTATVDLNYDYDYNRSTAVDEGTALSKLSKLCLGAGAGILEAKDDDSFEQQFAKDILETVEDDNDTKVKPFVVQAPPGTKLGMVIETETNDVPSVGAIRMDSPFRDRVRIGDLVISVNKQDVTNMTAMEVSELISRQQYQHRTLVFVRPEKPLYPGNDAEF